MILPSFLVDRPQDQARDVLHATSIATLSNFQAEGLIADSELEYGYEDLPHLVEMAERLAKASEAWHEIKGGGQTNFLVLQRGFVHAALLGLETAVQLQRRDGDGLRLTAALDGVLDGKTRAEVQEPLTGFAQECIAKLEDAFTGVQNQCLAAAAMTKDKVMIHDFFACACLWAALAGVEAGAIRLDAEA